MLIIPAIDLRGGKCVRLRQGRAEEMTVFSDDPVATGLRWQAAGAQWLHVVDLDGAFSGSPQNLEAIRKLRQALDIPMELGGGLRSLDTIRAYLDLGLDRLILGTVVLKDPDLAARACAEFPGKIAFGLDAKGGLLAVEGWTETSRRTALEVAQALEPLRPAAIIYTDIARDGVKQGVNLGATEGSGRGREYSGDCLGRGQHYRRHQGPAAAGSRGGGGRHHRPGPVRRQPGFSGGHQAGAEEIEPQI